MERRRLGGEFSEMDDSGEFTEQHPRCYGFMPPRLGLVCLSAGDEVRFRTVTRTHLRTLDAAAQVAKLREIYTDNLRRLDGAIDFCLARGISLYRLTSDLFPRNEEPAARDLLAELAPEIAIIGRRAAAEGIRLVMHPDQFVVLSSEKPAVVENSIIVLAHHAHVLDLLQQPRSPWAAMEIHGGKSGRGTELAAVIRDLPDAIRSRLALENDEYAYSAADILQISAAARVPMVFDAHHHVVHESLESYDHESIAAMTRAAAATWAEPAWQLVHISNGRTRFDDPKHADYIDQMPAAFHDVPWIEVEAKQKDLAIARLRKRFRRMRACA